MDKDKASSGNLFVNQYFYSSLYIVAQKSIFGGRQGAWKCHEILVLVLDILHKLLC